MVFGDPTWVRSPILFESGVLTDALDLDHVIDAASQLTSKDGEQWTALVRAPASITEKQALSTGASVIDGALLLPSLLPMIRDSLLVEQGFERRAHGVVVIDGLDSAPISSLQSLWWKDSIEAITDCSGLGVLMADHLPRPLTPTLDLVVTSLASCEYPERAVADKPVESHEIDQRLMTFIETSALDALILGRGCLAYVSDSDGGVSKDAEEAVELGLLRRISASPSRPCFLFPSLKCRDRLATSALIRLAQAQRPIAGLGFRFADYVFETQELSRVVHTRSWVRVTEDAARALVDSAIRSHFLRLILSDNPLLALAIVAGLGAGNADSNVVTEIIAGAKGSAQGTEDLATRASLAFQLDRIRDIRRQPVVRNVRSAEGDLSDIWYGEKAMLEAIPVTNREYEQFIVAGGYQNPAYWDERGRAWRDGDQSGGELVAYWLSYVRNLRGMNIHAVARERNWRGSRYRFLAFLCQLDDFDLKNSIAEFVSRPRDSPGCQGDFRFNAKSKPVVGINAFEAEAYCKWRSESSTGLFRLPTISEWRTAYGVVSGFPWGQQYRLGYGNTGAEGLGATTPVGTFPAQNGMFDMCGNVWEWTSSVSLSENSGSLQASAGSLELQAVMGGSWDNIPSYAEADRVDWDPPQMFGNRLGFRVTYTSSKPN